MALTRDQVVAEMTARRLSTRYVEGVGWVCDLGGVRVRTAPAPSPEIAVEAAVAELAARDAAAQERAARRVIQAQQQGTHFHRPRQETAPDPTTGEPITRTVFDVFAVTDDSAPVVSGARHVLVAWQALRDAQGAGEEPTR